MTADAEEFRRVNSYIDADGDRVDALTVTALDFVVPVIRATRDVLTTWLFLAQGHANLRVERKAVEIEMRTSLESLVKEHA